MLEVVDYRAMGDRLRERRRAMKLTQEELAKRIDISASFVGHPERAEKTPSRDTVAALCAALEVSMDWLVWGKHSIRCDRNGCPMYDEIRRVMDSY